MGAGLLEIEEKKIEKKTLTFWSVGHGKLDAWLWLTKTCVGNMEAVYVGYTLVSSGEDNTAALHLIQQASKPHVNDVAWGASVKRCITLRHTTTFGCPWWVLSAAMCPKSAKSRFHTVRSMAACIRSHCWPSGILSSQRPKAVALQRPTRTSSMFPCSSSSVV